MNAEAARKGLSGFRAIVALPGFKDACKGVLLSSLHTSDNPMVWLLDVSGRAMGKGDAYVAVLCHVAATAMRIIAEEALRTGKADEDSYGRAYDAAIAEIEAAGTGTANAGTDDAPNVTVNTKAPTGVN